MLDFNRIEYIWNGVKCIRSEFREVNFVQWTGKPSQRELIHKKYIIFHFLCKIMLIRLLDDMLLRTHKYFPQNENILMMTMLVKNDVQEAEWPSQLWKISIFQTKSHDFLMEISI